MQTPKPLNRQQRPPTYGTTTDSPSTLQRSVIKRKARQNNQLLYSQNLISTPSKPTYRQHRSLKSLTTAEQSQSQSLQKKFQDGKDWTTSSDKTTDSTSSESVSLLKYLGGVTFTLFQRVIRANPEEEEQRTQTKGQCRESSNKLSPFTSSSESSNNNTRNISPLKKPRTSTGNIEFEKPSKESKTNKVLDDSTFIPSPLKDSYKGDISFIAPDATDYGFDKLLKEAVHKTKPGQLNDGDYGKGFIKRPVHKRLLSLKGFTKRSERSPSPSPSGNTSISRSSSPSNKSFLRESLLGRSRSPAPKSILPPTPSRQGTPGRLYSSGSKNNSSSSLSSSLRSNDLSAITKEVNDLTNHFTPNKKRINKIQNQLLNNNNNINNNSNNNNNDDSDLSIISIHKLPPTSTAITLQFNESRNFFLKEYERLEKELKERKEREALNKLLTKERLKSLKPKSRLIKHITPDEEKRIVNLWRSGSDAKMLVQAHNIDLRLADLRTLDDGRWLNDNVIELYLKTLDTPTVFCYTPFFFTKLETDGYKGVAKWLKRSKREIIKLDSIIVPINIDRTHWVLGVIDLKLKKIYYLDSLAKFPTKHGERSLQLMKTYVKEQFAREGKHVNIQEYTAKQVLECPQQTNGYDCGIFTLINSLHFAKGDGEALCYDPDESKAFRRIVANELLKLAK